MEELNSPISQLTLVQPFHFKTDERLKCFSQPRNNYDRLDFVSGLRKCSPRSKLRSDTVSVKSDQTMKEVKKLKHPMTEKILQSKNMRASKTDSKKYVFRAQPVPKNIFEGIVGVKEKVKPPLTEPKSPQFSVRTRSQRTEQNIIMDEKERPGIVHKTYASHSIEPLSVTFEKKCTEIVPFTFDEMDKVRFSEKARRIEKEIKKERNAHKFKANPMPVPSFVPTGVPAIPKKSPTKTEPFHLMCNNLHEKNSKNQDHLNSRAEICKFKARDATVIQKLPFQAQKSTKPLTVPNAFHLNTEKRAESWANLEEVERQKAVENESVCRKLQEEAERKEKEEIAECRKQLVHKANPIRNYQAVKIQPSAKPLTEPCSPKLITNKRKNQMT